MKMLRHAVLPFAVVLSLPLRSDTGCPVWGGRRPHPAQVNSAVPESDGTCLSLRGWWDFSPQKMEAPWRNGVWDRFYLRPDWPNQRSIEVPSCWEAQGVGAPGPAISWDCKWDDSPKAIRHVHMGDGWYRKRVKVPPEWSGKRIWLKVGGIRSRGWIWANGKQVAHVDDYCGTYKYEITDVVKPGEDVCIVVQVNNTLPSRKGLMSAMHRWGGIYRDMELEATPQTYIDDVYVHGNFDAATADFEVEVGAFHEGDGALDLRASVDGMAVTRKIERTTGPQRFSVPLANFRAWTPEHPNLYTALVEVVDCGQVLQSRRVRFGVRKLEVRGSEFFLNGRPFFLRGFGDDHVYPMTGMSPADRSVHRAHLRKAREAGFNFVRLHTHCEVPEYFDAADELGILIQAELPYYSDVPTEGFAFDPIRDVTELFRNYRNHPSFAVYSMGNEGSFGTALDRTLHQYVKQMDPHRLKINQDCHEAAVNPEDASDYQGGPINVWARGSVNPPRPFVNHEYLNLCVKVDARDESRYSGVWMPPATLASRNAWLSKFGLDEDWGHRLQNAQHALQRLYQKAGVEAARSDPYCDGYCFWTIVDVVVAQGDAFSAQGLFNPFWDAKIMGTTAADFARFNSPCCVVADFRPGHRVAESGETIQVDVSCVNYGEQRLENVPVGWKLQASGALLAEGRLPEVSVDIGPVRPVGTASVAMPEVSRPVKASLEVHVGSVCNDWDLWLFPRRVPKASAGSVAADENLYDRLKDRYPDLLPPAEADKAQVVLAPWRSDMAVRALALGKRVLTYARCEGEPNVSLGWWQMGDQVGTALRRHEVFGLLPHDGHLDRQLFRVLKTGERLPMPGLKPEDMFMVGEGGSSCFVYLAQANLLKGKAVMAFGLSLFDDRPESAALLEGILKYMTSERFGPTSVVSLPAGCQ